MLGLEEEIAAVTQCVWNSTLRLEIEATGEGAMPVAPLLMAGVEISGEWRGRVELLCAKELAHRVAERMFGNRAVVGSEESADALREIANIIGGNLKTLLAECGSGGIWTLSAPWCTAGRTDYGECREVLAAVGFRSEGFPLTVRVLRA